MRLWMEILRNYNKCMGASVVRRSYAGTIMTSLRSHLRNFRDAVVGMAQMWWAYLNGKMQ